MPLPGVVEDIARHVPTSVGLTVTCSQKRGPAATIAVAVELLDRGYDVTAHLAARSIGGSEDLEVLVETLVEHNAQEVFVIGGDQPEPAGPYFDAGALIAALRLLGTGLRIGIAGYPEGHPAVEPERLHAALLAKAEHASYVTTQLCLDPATIATWAHGLAAQGMTLPVTIGVAGILSPVRLLDVSRRIGVGQSIRFARKNGAAVRGLVSPRPHSPDALVQALLDREGAGFCGLHVFTFNDIGRTMRWRDGHIAATGT
jgi:methylenetetrahydrofolate reductase (NADPH)